MPDLVVSITLFILALIIGIEVIGKVPATLHTPLMSGANSIHGIVIVGVVIVAGVREATKPRTGSSTISRRTTGSARWKRAKHFSGIIARMDSPSCSSCRSSIPTTSERIK